MSRELSDKETALLNGLRAFEALDALVDVGRLAERSGYAQASIRTYFSKKLEGVLVFKEAEGWRVRGALKCTPAEFARRMSQKAGSVQAALQTEDAWRRLLRKILYEGQRRGYRLGGEEAALVDKIRPRRPRVPQGDLFDPS
ncbi:MAG: hypothetical protein ACI8PZ_000451 [Myxococcota bacterium]|jgi:hypothetical protein